MIRDVGLAAWALLALAVVALTIVAGRSETMPTFGELVRSLTRHIVVRTVLLAGWVWLGWHVLVRSTR